MKSSKGKTMQQGKVLSYLITSFVMIIVTLLLLLVEIICINNEYVDLNNGVIVTKLIPLIATFIGTVINEKMNRSPNVIMGSIPVGIYNFAFMFVAIVFWNGVTMDYIWSLMMSLIGYLIGYYWSNRKNRMRKSKNWNKRNR